MIETSRLHIIPLTDIQLEEYLFNNRLFYKREGLADTSRAVSLAVRERIRKTVIPAMRKSPGNDYLYITFWIIVDKSLKTIVAELGFKGVPDANGEIEVGYGTMPDMRGRGYMTEAIGAMIEWASQQPGINAILAETDETNEASIRVVTRNGFVRFDKKENMLWWKRQLRLTDQNSG